MDAAHAQLCPRRRLRRLTAPRRRTLPQPDACSRCGASRLRRIRSLGARVRIRADDYGRDRSRASWCSSMPRRSRCAGATTRSARSSCTFRGGAMICGRCRGVVPSRVAGTDDAPSRRCRAPKAALDRLTPQTNPVTRGYRRPRVRGETYRCRTPRSIQRVLRLAVARAPLPATDRATAARDPAAERIELQPDRQPIRRRAGGQHEARHAGAAAERDVAAEGGADRHLLAPTSTSLSRPILVGGHRITGCASATILFSRYQSRSAALSCSRLASIASWASRGGRPPGPAMAVTRARIEGPACASIASSVSPCPARAGMLRCTTASQAMMVKAMSGARE